MTVAVGDRVRVTRCCDDDGCGNCAKHKGRVGVLKSDDPEAGDGPSYRYYIQGVGYAAEVERESASIRTFAEALAAIGEIAKERGDSACLELSSWVHKSGSTETRLKVWSSLDNAAYSASSYADVVERYRSRSEDRALIDGAEELPEGWR